MSDCHRSQSRLLFQAVLGNITVSGDGKEFMDITGELTCDIVVVAPEKHVLYVYLTQWDYNCDYYFSDVFLAFDTHTGPMNSLLPHQFCVSQGSHVYSQTNNVTLRFIWEPTGYAFRFVVDFRAVAESAPRTFATSKSPGYVSHAGPSVTKEAGWTTRPPGTPVLLENGLWNCSMTALSMILVFFRCNVRVECAGGEDEAVCPYTSTTCGVGSIAAGGSCFQFIRPQVSRTWHEASEECQRRGSQLAVLNSREEWRELYQIFQKAHHEKDYNRMAIGLRITPVSVSPLYRQLYQWVDKTIAYDIGSAGERQTRVNCGFLFLGDSILYRDFHFILMFRRCDIATTDYILCESPPKKSAFKTKDREPESSQITMPIPTNFTVNISTAVCPTGHLTHAYLACDVTASCFTSKHRRAFSCSAPLTPLPPMFTCANKLERVPYTSVCDHRVDCVDDSDESFCTFHACDQMEEEQCGNRECKPRKLWCDFSADCANEADEWQCTNYNKARMLLPTLQPPAIIDFKMVDKFVKVVFRPLETKGQDILEGRLCPETHFQCPGNGYCLPVFLRCNGMRDCPGYQDEDGCTDYTCPGLFRCHSSKVCVHAAHICDEQSQCPYRDDEAVCDFYCPRGCICYWNSFICVRPAQLGAHSDLRYLDASGTGMTLLDAVNNSMLVYLKLDGCRLTSLESPPLPNLQSLVVSNNELISIMAWHLANLSSVRHLDISRNPLQPTFLSDLSWATPLTNFKVLNFSGVSIPRLSSDDLRIFQGVQELYLKSCGIDGILQDGFQGLRKLRVLNVQGSAVTHFPPRMLKGLDVLQRVEADNYKFCCPVVLPEGFNNANCYAPQDEISSCGDLLHSDSYTVLLSVFAALSLTCNTASFLYRVVVEKVKAKQGFAVFVTHLCAADLFMGLYLAIIGVMDRKYEGSYLWNDESWKASTTCKLTGFLSLLSSEVSAFIICLITLDRFLVLQFPFSDLHFRRLFGHVACGIVWIFGIILASLPLLPVFEHWKFYSQTGMCIPLPITRKNYPGQDYSFGVMIVLNFVLFILIILGQGVIFWSVRAGSMSAMDTSKKSKDLAIARRLISIAMSDFLCWFPIGILGLLSSRGWVISGEVNVVIAIIVLPINSVLNPFLYTLNIIVEIRQRAREQRKQKHLLLKLQHDAEQNTRHCLKKGGDHERSVTDGHHDHLVINVQTHTSETDGKNHQPETGIGEVSNHKRTMEETKEIPGIQQENAAPTEEEAWLLLTVWFNSGIVTQEDILSSVTVTKNV